MRSQFWIEFTGWKIAGYNDESSLLVITVLPLFPSPLPLPSPTSFYTLFHLTKLLNSKAQYNISCHIIIMYYSRYENMIRLDIVFCTLVGWTHKTAHAFKMYSISDIMYWKPRNTYTVVSFFFEHLPGMLLQTLYRE